MKNPFNAQGPTDPRYYANRKELLELFKQNIIGVKESKGVTKPVNIAVLGQWGIGKTSTLYKFKHMLKKECGNAKVFSSIISLKPASCADADTFSVNVLETIYTDYASTVSLPDRVKNFISQELRVVENWRISRLSLKPELERKNATVRAINLKTSLKRFWEKLEASGFDLAVIMLDDIHYTITEGQAGILFNLRTDMQALSAEGARFMFIITGPMTLYPEMLDQAEPFTRLFERFNLEPFDPDGTRELIEKPLAAENMHLSVSNEVVQKIQSIAEGHPYFTTLIMRDLLNKRQEGKINLDEFIKIYPDVTEHFAKVKFDSDLTKATDAEKEILFKMAKTPKKELTPKEIGGKSKAKLLERLVKKDLVVKVARGKYKLYSKLFKDYLSKRT